MSDQQLRANQQAWQAQRPLYGGNQKARTGTFIEGTDDLDPNPSVGLAAGYVWVRIAGNRAATRALNAINKSFPDVPCIVGYNSGGSLVAYAVDMSEDAVVQYGDDLAGQGTPDKSKNTNNTVTPLALLEGGRVLPSSLGGLYVYVEAYIPGGLDNGLDVDLSADEPGSVNEHRWELFYLTSADVVTIEPLPVHSFSTNAGLLVSEARDFVLPDGSIRLFAVSLSNGQTVINASTSRFVDLRLHFEREGASGSASPLTTKGDVYTYDSADARLGVGSNGQVLTVNTAETTGLKWQAVPLGTGAYLTVNATAVGNVGVGEDDLITFSVPANTLTTNGDYLHGVAGGNFAASLNNKRLRAKLGSTTFFDTGALAITTATDWALDWWIYRITSSTQVIVATFTSSSATLAGFAQTTSAAEDLTTALTVKCTGEATANNDVQQETLSLERYSLGGGASLTNSSNYLSADVTMTNANQYYDGPSLSLATGTWYLFASLYPTVTGSNGAFTAKLWDGTTTYSQAQANNVAGLIPNAVTSAGIVVLGTTTTVKASMASSGAGNTISAVVSNNSAGNFASYLLAIKIA